MISTTVGTDSMCHAVVMVDDASDNNSDNNNDANDNNDDLIRDTDTKVPVAVPYARSVTALIPAIQVRNRINEAIRITKQIMVLLQQQQQPQTQSSFAAGTTQLQQYTPSSKNTNTGRTPEPPTHPPNEQIISFLLLQLQQLLSAKQSPSSTENLIFKDATSERDKNRLSNRNRFYRNSDTTVAQLYRERYQDQRQSLDLWAQPGAYFVQRGEIATWRRLQQQEKQLEQYDEIRAAFNTYMNQIQYSTTQYTLTVPESQRKQMIRTDTLPDLLRQVVPSDMDIRTLYRNQILTCLQDARAELQYQMMMMISVPVVAAVDATLSSSLSKEQLDVQELLQLLLQTQEAINDWFNMIDPNEIRRAEEAEELERTV
jgi:hypothetical protein